MRTIALYGGAVVALWALAGVTFALGFAVGRGFRGERQPVVHDDGECGKERGELSISTQELAVAQFSKTAWLTRPLM